MLQNEIAEDIHDLPISYVFWIYLTFVNIYDLYDLKKIAEGTFGLTALVHCCSVILLTFHRLQ